MPAELHPFAEVVDLDRGGPDPPYDYPDYVGTRLRAPKEPLVIIPATLTELTGPAYGESAIGALDADLTRQHAGAAARRADRRQRPRARLGRQAAARAARRDLAGERRGPLPARRRHPRRAARPELLGRRPLPHRRRRLVPVHDREAGRVPVGKPPERLAAESHPLLAVRARVHGSARDADVLPGRPALRARPDLQLDPGREGAGAARQPASTSG